MLSMVRRCLMIVGRRGPRAEKPDFWDFLYDKNVRKFLDTQPSNYKEYNGTE